MKSIVVVLLVGAVFGAVSYFMMPRAGGGAGGPGPAIVEEELPALPPNMVEVKLGSYICTNNREGRDTHVTFDLVAVVQPDQEFELKEINKQKTARIREQVISVIRSANLEDLEDASLRRLKQQMVESLNKTIERKAIMEVIMGEFQLSRQ